MDGERPEPRKSGSDDGAPAPEPPLTREEAQRLHTERLGQLRDLLAVIDRVKLQQAAWHDELQELYRNEALQDEQARALFREVVSSEMEFLADPEFHRWMARRGSGPSEEPPVAEADDGDAASPAEARERQQRRMEAAAARDDRSGAGRPVNEWYVEDALLALTPYLAVVPCPRNLSATGQATVAAAIDGIVEGTDMVRQGFVLERVLLQHHDDPPPPAAAADDDDEEEASSPTGSLRPPLVEGPLLVCHGSADALQALREDPLLGAAVDATPCLLLNDVPAPDAEAFDLLLIIVGGKLLAAEPFRQAFQRGTPPPSTVVRHLVPGDAPTAAASEGRLETALQRFFTGRLLPALGTTRRTCLAALRVTPRRTATETKLSFALLSLGQLEARDYDAFRWTDIAGLVATHVPRPKKPYVCPPTPPPADASREVLDAYRGKLAAAAAAAQSELDTSCPPIALRGLQFTADAPSLPKVVTASLSSGSPTSGLDVAATLSTAAPTPAAGPSAAAPAAELSSEPETSTEATMVHRVEAHYDPYTAAVRREGGRLPRLGAGNRVEAQDAPPLMWLGVAVAVAVTGVFMMTIARPRQ